MKTIVAATQNKSKIKEILSITKGYGMDIISRDEAGVPEIEIEEIGRTFEENSYLKAHSIMKLCGKITIADDSGLVVDCLGGAPGIYSARFGTFPGIWPTEEDGDNSDETDKREGTDISNNEKLINLVRPFPYEERTARFVSVITMVYPDGKTIVARGEVEGHVLTELFGKGGFGYDPLFVPEGYNDTFGVLDPKIKNAISHRAKALIKLRNELEINID